MRSVLSRGLTRHVFLCEFTDDLLENAPALLVIFKLVKTRAGGSQQDGVARLRALRGHFYGSRHGTGVFYGNYSGELFINFFRRASDQQHHTRVPA